MSNTQTFYVVKTEKNGTKITVAESVNLNLAYCFRLGAALEAFEGAKFNLSMRAEGANENNVLMADAGVQF